MAHRRKDADLAALAERAERSKADGDSSGFMSGALFASDFAIILGGCVEFHPDIPEFERKRIVLKVAHTHDLPRPITAESLLKECSRHEKEYLALPQQRYRLLTEISLWWTVVVPRVIVDDAVLTFKPKADMGFLARSKLFHESQGAVGFELPQH